MTEYGFTENEDYLVTSIFEHNSNGGKQSKIDHVLKLDRHISINKTPKITGKGQLYFSEKLLCGDIA